MHLLNQSQSLPGKRVGTYDYPRNPSEPLASLLGWLSYCKAADLAFLKKIHSAIELGQWKFMDDNHRLIILSLTSQLLESPSDKASSKVETHTSAAGAHWNSQLTSSSEIEPDIDDSQW